MQQADQSVVGQFIAIVAKRSMPKCATLRSHIPRIIMPHHLIAHTNIAHIFQMIFAPFVWSVTQLVRFFRDPKMANLLTGPGTQQHPEKVIEKDLMA